MSTSFDSRSSSMDSLLNEQQYVRFVIDPFMREEAAHRRLVVLRVRVSLRCSGGGSDKVYKIIVIGDSGVGKSSLLCRYAVRQVKKTAGLAAQRDGGHRVAPRGGTDGCWVYVAVAGAAG